MNSKTTLVGHNGDDLKAIEMDMHARGTGSITQGDNASMTKDMLHFLYNHVVMLMQRLKKDQNVTGDNTNLPHSI